MYTAAKIKASHGKGADFYRKHLSSNDYYSEKDKVTGHWKGNLASAFGLSGETVTQEVFSLFQQNIHPVTKEKLTPRNNPHSIRFYDFQCSAQKSVSVMALFDKRLAEAHRKAVEIGMKELERFAAVRVRKGDNWGTKNFLYTGKFVYAEYHHENSRLLDPQLHTHNVIVNVAQEEDGSFKALDASEMYRAIRYAGKSYQNALACECIRLGYDIEMKRSDKGLITGFELNGIDDEILKRCSRRREQIDKEIEKFVSERGRQPTTDEIKVMTLQTRSRKMLEKTSREVDDIKMALFTREEKDHFHKLHDRAILMGALRLPPIDEERAAVQVKKVMDQLFERHSVLRGDAILAEVQNQNLGSTRLEDLHAAIEAVPGLINLGKPAVNPYFTTEENIERENYSIQTVNQTKDSCRDFVSDYVPFSEVKDGHDHTAQKEVIETLISSKDPFMVFRGVAGAGKTSTLQELCKCLRKGGVRNIHVVAPTNSAVDVLRTENFNSAQTVAMFLQNQDKLPPKGSYLIIDESGLNSLKHGSEVIRLAMENEYRVLFVGDARQHSSVEAGDFFRLLEQHSEITKTSLSQIHRQQTAEYRQGIELIAAGSSKEGFEHLDEHGFIHEDEDKYLEQAAEDFVRFTDDGSRPLDCIAVSPTNRECDVLTTMIREKMKAASRIINDENNLVESFRSWGWTKPQLANIDNYQIGTKVFFNTKIRGIARAGEMAEVSEINDGRLLLSNGKAIKPSLIRSGIDVGDSASLPVGQGDMVRFTVNLRMPGYKINNGSLAIATGVPNEYILLNSNRRELMEIRLPENFKGIKYGWVMTSHVAQGMTAQNVVVAAEKMSKQAFYVACSRGKYKLSLHVPEKEYFLKKLMGIPTDRLSVHDLLAANEIDGPVVPEHRNPPGVPPAEELKKECRPDPLTLMVEWTKQNFAKLARKVKEKVEALSEYVADTLTPDLQAAGISPAGAGADVAFLQGKPAAKAPIDKPDVAVEKPEKKTKPTLEKPNVTRGPIYETYLMLMKALGEEPEVDTEEPAKTVANEQSKKTITEKPAVKPESSIEKMVVKPNMAAKTPVKKSKPTLEKPNVTKGPIYETYVMLMKALGEEPENVIDKSYSQVVVKADKPKPAVSQQKAQARPKPVEEQNIPVEPPTEERIAYLEQKLAKGIDLNREEFLEYRLARSARLKTKEEKSQTKSVVKPEPGIENPVKKSKPTLEKPNVTRGPIYETYKMLMEMLAEDPEGPDADAEDKDISSPVVMKKQTAQPEVTDKTPVKKTKPTLARPNVTRGPVYETYRMLMEYLGEEPEGPDTEVQDAVTEKSLSPKVNADKQGVLPKTIVEKPAVKPEPASKQNVPVEPPGAERIAYLKQKLRDGMDLNHEEFLEYRLARKIQLSQPMKPKHSDRKAEMSDRKHPEPEVPRQAQVKPKIVRNEAPVSKTDPVKFTGQTDPVKQRYEAVRQLSILIAAEHLDAIPYPVFSAMSVQDIIGLIETVPEKVRRDLIKPEPPRHEPPFRGRSRGIDF